LSKQVVSVLTLCLFSWIDCSGSDQPVPGELRRTFYVDSHNGKDTADGQSEDTAWRTLDCVNAAALQPGDTVHFKCGGVWRGSLEPVSGSENAPVTYTSYGEGPKPLLLGSRPRHHPADWVRVREHVWATKPMRYDPVDTLLELRDSRWHYHQEAGANVRLSEQPSPDGRTYTVTCVDSGRAPNHLQMWGPELALEKGTFLLMTLRARSSKPFRFPRVEILLPHSPWTRYAAALAVKREIGPEWEDYKVVMSTSESFQTGKLHINLGGLLPADAVFEFQMQDLQVVTPNVADPLTVDVGNIIFDHGTVCGWKKWSVDDLEKPYDYYYDPSSWQVFLCSASNPATIHDSIELAMKRHVVNQTNTHHVVYDGLAIRYGAAHGFGGGNTHHLVIRNCELGYIGGGHQLTRENGRPVRYGNGIEFWGAAHDNLVEGCRIWEVYDAALTNQGRAPSSKQVNITYRDNVIWNCEYSFEYWNHPETALTKNIRFVNNTCVNAGSAWSHAQRPDPNGSHLMFYSNTAETSGIEVKYNIFYNFTDWGSRYTSGWKVLPITDYNLWFSEQGVMVYWFRDKITGFADYQSITGHDAHSLFADPKFVDAANGDYRLAPNSPARQVRPGGGPVGATILWSAP
jgi:hypothetical protein